MEENAEEKVPGSFRSDQSDRRTLDQINREYEQLATLLGDIEAKLAILGGKKSALLRRIFELDAEAGESK